MRTFFPPNLLSCGGLIAAKENSTKFNKGNMSAIFSNTLKSGKLHFHQWKPENGGPGHWDCQ